MMKKVAIKEERAKAKQNSFIRSINSKFLNNDIENALERMTQK